jgi:hypothetical protein
MDAGWYGEVAWLSLYYQAALLATAQMADRMGDQVYAASLRRIAGGGRRYIECRLFNGEFYFHKADAQHMAAPGTYLGCHIDQLMGQNWAWQTGLGPILDPQQETMALNSIWKYNFTTNMGTYRKVFTQGRTYARAGEGGVVMCTFPLGGVDALKKGRGSFAAYMNETWAGCEHQLAATLMWQGFVDKALAVVRTIHERYDPAKRNPWDECECGSHYSRSLDSYGVFTAACGYEYDGPDAYIAFCPRVHPAAFRAAFTCAEGWGSFAQQYEQGGLDASIALRYGKLNLKSMALTVPDGCMASTVSVSISGNRLPATSELSGRRLLIHLAAGLHMEAGQTLVVRIR